MQSCALARPVVFPENVAGKYRTKPVRWRRLWSFFGGPQYPSRTTGYPWITSPPGKDEPFNGFPTKREALLARGVKQVKREKKVAQTFGRNYVYSTPKTPPPPVARIQYGVRSESQANVVGLSIADVSSLFREFFGLPPSARAYLGTHVLPEDYRVQPGDQIEFHRGFDPASRERDEKAVLKRIAENTARPTIYPSHMCVVCGEPGDNHTHTMSNGDMFKVRQGNVSLGRQCADCRVLQATCQSCLRHQKLRELLLEGLR